MPKERPKFKLYISDYEKDMNYKNEDSALWKRCSKGGKLYYGGKLVDGRLVQIWPVQEKEDDGTGGDQAPEDVPF